MMQERCRSKRQAIARDPSDDGSKLVQTSAHISNILIIWAGFRHGR